MEDIPRKVASLCCQMQFLGDVGWQFRVLALRVGVVNIDASKVGCTPVVCSAIVTLEGRTTPPCLEGRWERAEEFDNGRSARR
jgi:hypothetical protein